MDLFHLLIYRFSGSDEMCGYCKQFISGLDGNSTSFAFHCFEPESTVFSKLGNVKPFGNDGIVLFQPSEKLIYFTLIRALKFIGQYLLDLCYSR